MTVPDQDTRQTPIKQSKVLIVEGKDDVRFLQALLRHLKIAGDFDIRDVQGVGNLGDSLRTVLATPDRNIVSLGIIRDADQRAQSAFQSVCSGLHNAGLSVPRWPLDVVGEKPRVSVFIWPDCENTGMLETLCLASVAASPALVCIDQFFECIEQDEDIPSNMDKARLHAFLASRDKPGLRLGEAADKGYWPWDHPVFEPIKAFLHAM
ncbi:MAG: hypothetical protein JXQ72_17395 [Anaerolineae bacterium]|nr:hypothetical protein [Anaerolineae bacterium]